VSRRWFSWTLAPVVLLLAIGPWKAKVVYWEGVPPSPREIRDTDRAVSSVRPSEVLCLDAFYGQSRGMDIPFADAFHASCLAGCGVADFAPEAAALRHRGYRLVIGNQQFIGEKKYHGLPLLPEAISAALRDEYEIAYAGRWLVLWTPLKPE